MFDYYKKIYSFQKRFIFYFFISYIKNNDISYTYVFDVKINVAVKIAIIKTIENIFAKFNPIPQP